jgi:putative ABC transport system permease protein
MGRLLNLLPGRRRRMERELQRELRHHLDSRTEELIRSGLTTVEARRRAALEFGGVARVEEEVREAWTWGWVDSAAGDFRYALRSLAAAPGFVFLCVVCLALGIGANTAVFSMVNGLLLQPPPFADVERLFIVEAALPDRAGETQRISASQFLDLKRRVAGSVDLAAARGRTVAMEFGQEPERQSAALVTANLLPLLGISPIYGATFQEYDNDSAHSAALLSEATWEERFDRSPDVLGRVVIVDSQPYTVAGVVPRLTHPAIPGLLRSARVWLSIDETAEAVSVVGRPVGGLSLDGAADRLDAAAAELAWPDGDRARRTMRITPITSPPGSVRSMLLIMMGAVGIVLLIACGNVANLMLARANRRGRELAIRAALGASPSRLLRQLTIESLIVGLLSTPFGLLLGWWGVTLLLRTGSSQGSNIRIPLDGAVLGFTVTIALATSLLFGLLPGLQALRRGMGTGLHGAGRADTGDRSQRIVRGGLVVSEVALSVVLLIGAALFVRSFNALIRSETHMDTASALTLRFEKLPATDELPDISMQRVTAVLDHVQQLPGIEAAAVSNMLPLRGGGERAKVVPEGIHDETVAPTILMAGVTSRFFYTLGAPLLQGRDFTVADTRRESGVAIVNNRLAERLWPGQNAVGNRLRLLSDADTWFTIVGVARDLPNWDLSDRPVATMYVPYPYTIVSDPRLLIRTTGPPEQAVAAVRSALRAVDSRLVMFEVQTMTDIHRSAFWRQRMLSVVFSVFGVVAGLLTITGLYGVLSYLVAQRTREIGVRIALGANQRRIALMVIRQAFTHVLAGVLVGLPVAFGLTRVIRRYLLNINPVDSLSFVGVVTLVVVTGLLAAGLPAARAASVDPVKSLGEGT